MQKSIWRVFVKLFLFLFFVGLKLNATTYYVTTSGNDGNSGLSEASAWRTIAYAANHATIAGDIVYVKAGLYDNENVNISSGISGNLIRFEGYKNTPGDITNTDWWSYPNSLDASEMPLLDGHDRSDGNNVAFNMSSYTEIKNFQIENYYIGVLFYGGDSHGKVENIIGSTLGPLGTASGNGIKSVYGDYNEIKNCTIVNSAGEGISLVYTTNSIIDGCKVYCDELADGTDYYILITSNDGDSGPDKSNFNTIRNCYIERADGVDHGGAGIGMRGTCEYNTIEDCTAKNLKNAAFYVRHRGANNNTFNDCLAIGSTEGDGFIMRDGAHDNKFNNCKTDGCVVALGFYFTNGDPGATTTGNNNVFYNCIFSKTKVYQMNIGSLNFSKETRDNSFINCVFDGGDYLFNTVQSSSNNSMTNCIVTNVSNYKQGNKPLTFNYTNSDFYSNGFATPAGTNLLSSNPQFVDLANADYHLTSSSPCINAGTSNGVTLPDTDYEGNTRVQGGTVDIGAFETSSSSSTNYALKFNGEATKDEFVELLNVPTSGTVTIEFWVKLEGSNDDTDVMINMGGDGKRLTLKSGSHLPAWTDGWNAYSSSAGISLNEWHHVAYVANNGTLSVLYIDGVSQTIGGNTSVSMPSSTWYLASWYGGGTSNLNFIGCLDELRLWNDARTASEISSNKDLELTGNEQGLVGYWNFNEGSGTTLGDSKGNANGTLYNMESSDWVAGVTFGGGGAPVNNPPVANAGADQTLTDNDGNNMESVTLDGSGSSDSDGTIENSDYVWQEGGTQIATGVNPTVSLSVGTHTITLTVTDDDNATASDDVLITINSGSGSSSNYALQFNGEAIKDEFVELSNVPTSGTVTIEFWVKLEGSNDDTDVMINMGGDGKRLTLKSGSHLPAWTDGWDAYSSSAGIGLNEWHHIAYVASSGTLSALYIDGVSQTIGGSTSVSMPSSTWYLASWYGGGTSNLNFIGCLDELRLWNDARTASEISSNKDLELTGNEQGLIGYWNFNEGSGTTLTDSKGSANGTLYNMESSDWVVGASSLSKRGGSYDNKMGQQIPTEFKLFQNYPNPFNPSTVISFALPTSQFVNLSVYNIVGEKVAELINGTMVAGNHTVTFDASSLTSGIYIYRISAGNYAAIKKMMLIK